MTANYTINQELNGIEITFDSKPEAATLEALKANGYRWHRVKKLWYAKNTAERLSLAQSIADGQTAAATATKAASTEAINLDNLGANKPSLYGAELAKAIREDLKRRGVKGVTVRARRVTYDTGITVTIKATAADFASIEEMKKRYSFSDFLCAAASHGIFDGEKWVYNIDEYTEEEKSAEYEKTVRYQASKTPSVSTHHIINCRNDYYTITTDFYNKIVAVFKIANQWNYDHSDTMSDYFDVGYYLDIDIKDEEGREIRETMTDEERNTYAAEVKAEEEKRAAELAAWEAEQEERRRQAEEAAKIHKANREKALAGIAEVKDLDESEQIYITNLYGGIGKECTLAELDETIKENPQKTDALITRKVIFSNREAFEAFGDLLLDDFEFLANKGGTAAEDVRLEEVKRLYDLNEEQRQSVKWFCNDCVACYIGDDLQIICDPQGFTYSRYTYRPSEESEQKSAKAETDKQRKESEEKTPFYFPEPVKNQAEKIRPGDQITVYQCDGWILNSVYDGAGTVASVEPGSYAQYNGIVITYANGKKSFIRDGKKCLIYKGIKSRLPESVTARRITANMSELLNYGELLPAILDYYSKQGEKPILDTIQR